ncbi:hypothetical protein N7508_005985 [Penicillium antarcticum]|uniref:uncharacterized protein n=1 Tax=Penicillium antarcticum TaxID=416450 RepID=UPI0023A249AE|nr:uncharacterized protein N7508_005985 [Penicillium antarcticum]KAJ5306970.1 hypothetical protein N7508_005985 [Penicillium antarcticum]
MKAYKGETLDCNPSLVTYWSKGTQICEPRSFDMDKFMHGNTKHEGHTGFWVEGFNYIPEAQMRSHFAVGPPAAALGLDVRVIPLDKVIKSQ